MSEPAYNFGPEIHPVSIDRQGFEILDKLEEGGEIISGFAGANPAILQQVEDRQEELKTQLRAYKTSVEKAGRRMFSFGPEVRAMKNGQKGEDFARYAAKVTQADENTFNSILEESGDVDSYARKSKMVRDPQFLKDHYTKNHLFKKMGYTDRMINSGLAEIMVRDFLGADEESSEPTIGAFKRWSLSQVNEYDRSRSLTDAAKEQAFNDSAGTSGDFDAFEDTLEDRKLTNTERTDLRRLYRIETEKFQKQFGGIRKKVQKAYNTIVSEEELETKFADAGSYESMADAIQDLGKIPKKDFPNLLFMLSKTAEAHEQDVDQFFNKLGKNFTRGVEDLFGSAASTVDSPNLKRASALARKARRAGGVFEDTGSVPLTASGGAIPGLVSTQQRFVKATHKKFGTVRYITNSPDQSLDDEDYTFENVTSDEDFKAVVDHFESRERANQYASQIRNWREEIAKVDSDNMLVDTVVYGTARSIPEMAAAATGIAGLGLVAAAQYERNMSEIRAANPDGDWGQYRVGAWTGAMAYSLLNRAQFKTATKGFKVGKSGFFNAAKRYAWEGTKRGLLEGVQETAQDLSFATTMELYQTMLNVIDEESGEDGTDLSFNMFNAEGVETDWSTTEVKEGEGRLIAAIKNYPKTLLAVSPLVVGGMMGRAALDHFEHGQYRAILQDTELLKAGGMEEADITEMQKLTVPEALDYMQENGERFLENIDGKFEASLPDGPPENTAQISDNRETFTVTNGEKTAKANSPEEVAEVMMAMDPEYSQRMVQDQKWVKVIRSFPPNVTPTKISSGDWVSLDTAEGRDYQQEYAGPDWETNSVTAYIHRDDLEDMETGWAKGQTMQVKKVDAVAYEGGSAGIGTSTELSEARFSADNQTTAESIEGTTVDARPDLENWGKTLSPAIDVTSPIGHPDVTKGLLKSLEALGVKSGIRYAGGKKLRKGTLGQYDFREGLLRVAQHGNITTAAHEMAHAIQDQYLYPGKPFRDSNWYDDSSMPDAAKVELANIAGKYYAGGTMGATLRKKGQLLSEGFAEYIRLRMQGDTSYSAPAFDAWFEKKVLDVNPEFKKAFLATSKLMQDYDLQGSSNRMRGNVAPAKTLKDKAGDAMIEAKASAVTKMVESFNPLKKVAAAVQGMTGKVLPDVMNPYLIAKRRRYTHSAVTAQMIETGMVDFVGRSKGEKTSLKYALRDITENERTDFTIYMWARRALSLHKKGKNPGVTLKDAEATFNELHNPRFERAATLVYDWNDAVLQYAADSSKDYAEVVRNIRDMDAGDYIPLAREFESFQKRYNSFSGAATGGNLVKRLKGSGRRIKDPFVTLAANAEKLVLRAHERAIIESLFALTKLKDPTGQPIKMGPIITKADPARIPVAYRNAADLANEIARVLDGEMSDLARELGVVIKDSDQADAMVTLWGQAYNPPNKMENPIIPIFIDGKREFYEVDRNAYESLGGLDMYRPHNLAMTISSMTTQAWRAGTTGYSATFQMVTNPLRDVRTLYQQTRSEAGFLRVMGNWSHAMAGGVLEGLSAKYIQSEWSRLYDNLGLEMVTPLGQDANYTRKAVRNLFTPTGVKKVVRTVDPRNIGAYFRDAIQYAEKATRLTEIKLLARDIGFDPKKDELTPEIAQQLALAAREVTTDFSASGSVGKTLNQILPFWNSQVQGVRAHVRSYNDSAAKLSDKGRAHQYFFNAFMAKGLMMSGIGIAVWLRNKDEEWWKEMPQDEKYNHTFIPIPKEFSLSGESELLKIPRAFELDGVFMGLPVSALDSFYQENPKEAIAWAKRFLKSAIPNYPVILNFMLESEGKEDFFGRPVIPEREKVLDVDGERYRQFGPQTTKVAKNLGKWFDMSPRRVDHVMKSFFGRAGIDALEVFGTSESDIREPHLTRFPILGALFHPKGENPYSPKSVTDFYDLKQELEAKASKINQSEKETDDQRLTRLMINDAADALTVLREVRKITTQESEIRKLTRMETDIAKEALKSFKEKTIDREKFQRMEAELEAELGD